MRPAAAVKASLNRAFVPLGTKRTQVRLKLVVVDAKPSDLHMSRMKSR